MSYSYFAKVTFPASALLVPEVQAAVPTEKAPWYDVREGDGVVEVSGGECRHGEIDIIATLEEHAVPYDHYQSYDCESLPEPDTTYVRFPNGERTEVTVSEEDAADASIASSLLELLNAGDIETLRSTLRSMREKGPPPDIEDVAIDWKPQEVSS